MKDKDISEKGFSKLIQKMLKVILKSYQFDRKVVPKCFRFSLVLRHTSLPTTFTLSTTPCTKWLATRLATAKRSRVCLTDTSSNFSYIRKEERLSVALLYLFDFVQSNISILLVYGNKASLPLTSMHRYDSLARRRDLKAYAKTAQSRHRGITAIHFCFFCFVLIHSEANHHHGIFIHIFPI